MDFRVIKTEAGKIRMPAEMKHRVIEKCSIELTKQMEENSMKERKKLRKPVAVFAALAVCLTLSVTALAAPGTLRGYFRDITDYCGAVVGTSYEQATDEISMYVSVAGDELTVFAVVSDPQMIPYRFAEKLGIAAYQIVDAAGSIVKEGAAAAGEFVGGQAAIRIPLEDMESGGYKLIITAFVSEKKADQPLRINGRWECDFSK